MDYYYDTYRQQLSLSNRDFQQRLRKRRQAEILSNQIDNLRYENSLQIESSYGKEAQRLRQLERTYGIQRQIEQLKLEHINKLNMLRYNEKQIERSLILQRIKKDIIPQHQGLNLINSKNEEKERLTNQLQSEIKNQNYFEDKNLMKSYEKIKKQREEIQKQYEDSIQNKQLFEKRAEKTKLDKYTQSSHKKDYFQKRVEDERYLSPQRQDKHFNNKNDSSPIIKEVRFADQLANQQKYTNSRKIKKKEQQQIVNSPDRIKKNQINLQGSRKKNEIKQQFQIKAMKRIQNRLKLAVVVYKDSDLRNLKYQNQHLFNTYQNQCKIRKDIKDRINNNPKILKKHKMVVQ